MTSAAPPSSREIALGDAAALMGSSVEAMETARDLLSVLRPRLRRKLLHRLALRPNHDIHSVARAEGVRREDLYYHVRTLDRSGMLAHVGGGYRVERQPLLSLRAYVDVLMAVRAVSHEAAAHAG